MLQKINDREIASPGDFYRALNEETSDELMMRVLREQNVILIGLVK